MAKILVTGAAGFIGYHTATRLLERGDTVVGLDSMSDYYDVSLKEARLARLRPHKNFRFEHLDVADRDRDAGAVRAGALRSRRAPRGTGGRALLARSTRTRTSTRTSSAS